MDKKRVHPKWILCVILALAGLLCLFVFLAYQTIGLLFLGLAGLICVYHSLKILRQRRPKLGKALTGIVSVVLCVFFIAASLTLWVIARSAQETADEDCQYLVVLGAKVNGSSPSLSLRERLDAACEYLNTYPDAIAIVSGGKGSNEDLSEAQCMFDYLTAAGIAPERIWMEDQATNTIENLTFSLNIIEERTGTRPGEVAVVSSEYHLYRANLFAQRLGLHAELVPAKTSYPLLRLNYFLREVFAVWYYTIIGG